MSLKKWGALALWTLGCASAPKEQPTASPPAATKAVAIPTAASSSPGNWKPVEEPRKIQVKISELKSCAAALRAAEHLDSEQGADLYASALTNEQGLNANGARLQYLQVIQNFPTSPIIPFAYLAFGEMFAEEAAQDPSKWALAQQAYRKVLEYPPDQNTSYTYTLYRLSETSHAQGEEQQALDHARKTIEAAKKLRQPCAEFLIPKAQILAVEAYSKVGTPSRAEAFFTSLGADEVEVGKMLQLLADEYQRAGDTRAVCQVARSLRAPAELRQRCLPP